MSTRSYVGVLDADGRTYHARYVHFDGDPRTVRPAGGGAPRSLDDVRTRHGRSRLWVVSAAERGPGTTACSGSGTSSIR